MGPLCPDVGTEQLAAESPLSTAQRALLGLSLTPPGGDYPAAAGSAGACAGAACTPPARVESHFPELPEWFQMSWSCWRLGAPAA